MAKVEAIFDNLVNLKPNFYREDMSYDMSQLAAWINFVFEKIFRLMLKFLIKP